ncbi:MAG: DNRLRE domain-containing protein [Limisphaerales bacterium]
MRTFLVIAGLLGGLFAVQAESIVLHAVADTCLIEISPTNNMGGHNFFNAGTTLNGTRNRGLMRFDPAEHIPAGSKIKSVQLVLEVVGVPIDEPAAANFQLHRMLRSWGEGDKISGGGPGRGAPATEGEATWNDAFALTTTSWATPGGLAGIDFVAAASAEQFIYAETEPCTFTSNPKLVADVQSWLDQPGSNHGWMLKPEIETVMTTARRFASREDHEYGPMLTVEFDPPPRLQIDRLGNHVHVAFQTQPDEGYLLQSATDLNAPVWSVLTNISAAPATTTIRWTNLVSGAAAFYRIQVQH